MRRSIRERGRGRLVGTVLTLTFAALVLPSTASASFHLTKISEVYAGTGVTGTDSYVELQAYQAGQNLLSGHNITVYDNEGVQTYTTATNNVLTNVPNAQSQRTALLGAGPLANGVTPDFTDATLATKINKNGGAACFDSIPVDCVAWGNFTGSASIPGVAGTPVAPTGIPNGSSITRDISAGCATLLEASDDTDNSSVDFKVTTEKTPRPNSVAPTEKACTGGGGGGGTTPDTTIDKGPKKKTTKTSAKFKFSADQDGADFECAVDGGKFKDCTSPLKIKKLKPGKHEFEVRAVLSGAADKSPASYKWKVTKEKKK